MQHSKTRGGMTGSNTKPKTSGQKAADQQWQRAPTSEKKRASRIPDLGLQLARLQEELKKTKDELHEAESRAKEAYVEAEISEKKLAAMSAKLVESQNQLDELWACEESRIHELRKISQERDRAWESELKAVQKHLAMAITENQKLNIRLQKVAESETTKAIQAESAQLQLSETVNLVEELKIQLNESKDSESRALELVDQTREQLEMVKLRQEKEENGEVELAAALAATAEMEGELRRLKVQTEQWRKAAEVAAAMVLGDRGSDGGGRFGDSFEFNVIGEKSNSTSFEDTEDESSIKKTRNMLKKIGVLLKKGQK